MQAYISERQAFLTAAYESSQLQDFYPEPPPDSPPDRALRTAVSTGHGYETADYNDNIDLNSFLASAPTFTPPSADADSLYDQQLAQFMRKLELRKEAKAKQHRKLKVKKNRTSALASVAKQAYEHSQSFLREDGPVSGGGATRFDFDSEGKSDYELSAGFGREGREIREVDPLREFEPHYSHHNKQAADNKEEQRRRDQHRRQRHDSTDRVKVRWGVDSSWDAAWQEEHEDLQQASPNRQWNDNFEERYASHRRRQEKRQSQQAPHFEYGQGLSGDVEIGGAYERMLARQHLKQEPKVEWREESQNRAPRERQSHIERKHCLKGDDKCSIDRPKSASAAASSRRHRTQAGRAPLQTHRHGLW